jgi:uncharacterized protein YhbP (UPF0306 family)
MTEGLQMTGEFERIEAFIRRHHVMTVATVGPDGRPWTAHVFYAWMGEERRFVFTTDEATRHGAEMAENARVAAGIALETRIVGRVQGLQIEGAARRAAIGEKTDEKTGEKARHAYLKRFPYAVAAGDLPLWILEPTMMKLTDNTLGFGKKLIWQR